MHPLWLSCHHLHIPLNEGASDQELQALQLRWGRSLPEPVLALLREHNGWDRTALPDPDVFVPIKPLGTQGIIEALDQMEEVLESGEASELMGLGFPLLEVAEGNFLVLFQDAPLGERLACWPMLSEVTELWFLDLHRFASALKHLSVQKEECTFDLPLDYPAVTGPYPGDANAATWCLQQCEQKTQQGSPVRRAFYFDLALQLWPQDQAAEILKWPQVMGEQPEVGLQPRARMQAVLQTRGLGHLLG